MEAIWRPLGGHLGATSKPIGGHYLIHSHCGQHLQPDCWARRLYTLDCFTEQLVGLSVTQPITEKRRWRLSFTSFYPVMH